MPRTIRDATLDSRTARLRLKAEVIHWRTIDRGRHLGYRRGPRGGIWYARFLDHDGRYVVAALGSADDTLDTDGVEILPYAKAQARARDWFETQARKAAGEPGHRGKGPYTVAHAIDDYLQAFSGSPRTLVTIKAAINAHIRPALGHLPVEQLTYRRLTDWHHRVAASAPRRRSRAGTSREHTPAPSGPDAIRARRSTANNVLGMLRAILNRAWRDGVVRTDEPWRRVKPFRHVDQPVVRYLSEAESVRLVNASDPGFRPIVQAALLTGCRYAELAALVVSDFDHAAGTLAIRTTKSGKPRHVALTDEGRTFFSQASVGKTHAALLLPRPDGGRWGKSQQQRPLAAACKRAAIRPAISFHILRHTYASTLARRAVPLPVIAKQLGHADTRMTERHYAHLAPNYVADTIRAHFPTLGIVPIDNVAPIRLQAKT